MDVPHGAWIGTAAGYLPIETVQEASLHLHTGEFYPIKEIEQREHTGLFHAIYTGYHEQPLLVPHPAAHFVLAQPSESGWKCVEDLTTADWIGSWCPHRPSLPLPPVDPFSMLTYAEALVLQFHYHSHRRPLMILQGNKGQQEEKDAYFCHEPSEPQDIGFQGDYVWYRIQRIIPRFTKEVVYSFCAPEDGFTIQGMTLRKKQE
jgi:hypothetical protein